MQGETTVCLRKIKQSVGLILAISNILLLSITEWQMKLLGLKYT